MIVFPAIDLRRGRCVRLQQGRAEHETVYADDPATVARRWVALGARWLHVVNLDGALGEPRGRPGTLPDSRHTGPLPVNLQRLAQIREAVPGTPIQFGGGVRSLADIKMTLDLGAGRVILGTAAIHEPELLALAVQRFGPERIAVGIDAREGRVATHGWRQTTSTTALALGQAMRQRGVVRVIYTDIARDGTLTGLNIEATVALARATGLRVIASGGVASMADVTQLGARAGGRSRVEGVIIGQALYSGVISLSEAIRVAHDRQPGQRQGAPSSPVQPRQEISMKVSSPPKG
jgi:phosphoribosylformimino-5-aminoimidazole carboxamide ribotide isomerase